MHAPASSSRRAQEGLRRTPARSDDEFVALLDCSGGGDTAETDPSGPTDLGASSPA